MRCFVKASLARAAGMIAVLAAAAVSAAPADAQGVGYKLIPTIEYIRWDDALGLEDTYFYGGKVGLTFGELVSLQPFYLFRTGVEGDSEKLADDSPLARAATREMDIRHFGADLNINLSRGDVVPFVRAGGGILRFEPDGLERADQITLKAGGGLRFGFGNLQAELFAEDLAFRINRFRLYAPSGGAPPGADPEADEERHNLVAGAGITIPLGSHSDVSEAGGLQGAAVPLEPFVGRLDYDDEVGLDEQNVVGVRTGLDFNAYFGLRGYYWRGINDDFDDTDEVQSYGGEAQFNLNTGPGFSPYLVGGAGRIDYTSDFRDPMGVGRDDRTALILGGGMSIGLSERARINVAVRDYIFDQNAEFEDVSNTDDLLHNWFYSAGVTFSLGGRAPTVGGRDTDAERRLRAETERLRRENERLREGRDIERVMETVVDTVVVVNERGEREIREVVREQESGRTITIPVPARGEINLRYGPGGIDAGEIRAIIRDEMERAGPRAGMAPGGVSEQELQLLEQRLSARINEIVAGRLGQTPPAQPGVVVVPGQPGVDLEQQRLLEERLQTIERRLSERIDALVVQRVREELDRRAAQAPVSMVTPEGDTVQAVASSILDRFAQIDVRQTRPYIGVNIDDPTQLVIGGRVDLGPLTAGSPFDLVPEVAFGIGESDPTLLVAANLRYGLGSFGGGLDISPYLLGGVGLFSRTVLAVNAAVGASFDLRQGLGAPLRTFAEYQGINFFSSNRLLLGVSLQQP